MAGLSRASEGWPRIWGQIGLGPLSVSCSWETDSETIRSAYRRFTCGEGMLWGTVLVRMYVEQDWAGREADHNAVEWSSWPAPWGALGLGGLFRDALK